MGTQWDKKNRQRRQRFAVAGGIVLAAGSMIGTAVAAPASNSSDVSFVALSAPHKVLSATLAANKTDSPVVSGGSTTVPSDATTVQLTVTAKGKAGGVINFYPADNIGAASGQSLSYPAGSTVASATIEEKVGQSDELTVANNGSGSATVTADVVGYSTQAVAGDVSGAGGSAGQVLTDNGAGGAGWQGLPADNAANFSGSGGVSGQVLTNTGDGAAWQSPNAQSALTATTVVHPTSSLTHNGSALRTAIAGGASLILLEPGTYDVGNTPLSVGFGQTVEGAGTQSLIQFESGGVFNASQATEILDLTIELQGTAQVAITNGSPLFRGDYIAQVDSSTTNNDTAFVVSGNSPDVEIDDTDIDAEASGPFTQAVVQNSPNAFLDIRDSQIDVRTNVPTHNAFAINAFGQVDVTGSTVQAVGGSAAVALLSQGGPIDATSSQILTGPGTAIDANNAQILVGESLVSGPAIRSGTGTYTCGDDISGFYIPLSAACT